MGKTLTEKIFSDHFVSSFLPDICVLNIDLLMCHEVNSSPAVAEIEGKWGDVVFDPSKIVALIDHVNPANDSATARQGQVMRNWARRHKIQFYDIGRNGICHAILPERGHVFPSMTVIGSDSHTCTSGAFGAFAAGIGTTAIAAAILKGVTFLKPQKVMRICLEGHLPQGVFAKDIILYLISQLGTSGAIGHTIEFCGPVINALEMEGRMTICNMTIEAGATSGICYPDEMTLAYYEQHKIKMPESFIEMKQNWYPDEDAHYEQERSFDLSELEPQVTFGSTPADVCSVSEMAGFKVDQVYIGSCTNGRISDLRIAAGILRGRRIADSIRLIVVPATAEVQRQAIAEGLASIFIDADACFTAPMCGACSGMANGILAEGEVCAATTNRNFPGRMGKGGRIYLMSPATAAATALNGVITDPREVI